jgi:hypothetical protein
VDGNATATIAAQPFPRDHPIGGSAVTQMLPYTVARTCPREVASMRDTAILYPIRVIARRAARFKIHDDHSQDQTDPTLDYRSK